MPESYTPSFPGWWRVCRTLFAPGDMLRESLTGAISAKLVALFAAAIRTALCEGKWAIKWDEA